jgi:uncharacterized GH25 family protein
VNLKKQIISMAALVVLLCTTGALAHDYWLEPENFFVTAGASVNVRMYLGGHLTSEEERPYKASATIRFELLSAHARQDISTLARDGETPVANLTLTKPGGYLLAMERKAQTITLLGEKFTEYLKEEGLDSIIQERARAGESESFGRERYNRYLKTLLQVGDKHDDTYQRIVGHRLEIVPQSNPYKLKPGSTLKLRVLFEGQPLSGATVFAVNRADGKIYTEQLQTARDGTITVKLERAGVWLIRMVHMQRCIKCEGSDWESFWTAISFGMKNL